MNSDVQCHRVTPYFPICRTGDLKRKMPVGQLGIIGKAIGAGFYPLFINAFQSVAKAIFDGIGKIHNGKLKGDEVLVVGQFNRVRMLNGLRQYVIFVAGLHRGIVDLEVNDPGGWFVFISCHGRSAEYRDAVDAAKHQFPRRSFKIGISVEFVVL